ncbi:MAG: outer membrane protein assembly factor BamE [Pseudomonadales bacterium]|nr:outer membrane protein assembly factor BamE [Pseudomonadales bacterium]
MSRRFAQLLIVIMVACALVGCSSLRFPGVHRITVQQGNVITQQMIDKLKPGMTRSQVRFVLGNAVIDDQLDADRWDYVYSIQIAGGNPIRKVLTVYFLDDRLSYFVGDFVPSEEYEAFVERGSQS